MQQRIGIGYDVHRLEKGLPMVLGGVEIPSDRGPVGHSDGDVLIHAICDAMLGAAALGDIGSHFPDTSDEYKGIDSRILLERSRNMVIGQGYALGNIDSTVCLQQPRIAPHIGSMANALSKVLRIPEDRISIKATTGEGLGFIGDGSGISAYAVVLLVKS
jgi:2-C-methyl-D-erythritol 2,4-cyclodiphosphate synthase